MFYYVANSVDINELDFGCAAFIIPCLLHVSSFFIANIISLLSWQVEYVDHSGQARSALAEAPNEALPDNCRPSFGAAWLTKDKFKVSTWDAAFGMNGVWWPKLLNL